MKKKIQPITALRDTNALDKEINSGFEPIFVTKNGYSDLVVMSQKYFEEHLGRQREDIFAAAKDLGVADLNADQSDPLGFVKVRAATIQIEVCGVRHNLEEIEKALLEAEKDGIKVLVLQELALSGYTVGDMLLTSTLQKEVAVALRELEKFSRGHQVFVSVGAPLAKDSSLYNCAVNLYDGQILGVTPKSYLPNYSEFYEKRHFQRAPNENGTIEIGGRSYPFGTKIIYIDENYLKLKIAVEICEDLWVPETPSTACARMGADLILNLSASNEVVGKKEFRESLLASVSSRLLCAYVYSDAGAGESTTDLIFSGHDLIAENGKILAESALFSCASATAEIDLEKISSERIKTTSFENAEIAGFRRLYFAMPLKKPLSLARHYAMNPFIPERPDIDLERVSLILAMQAMGLVKRLLTVRQKKVLVGVSGGLDSTLALLVAVEAFKRLGYDRKGIEAVTLPAFGTSKRTHDNACLLASCLGVGFREINLSRTLLDHFADIGHSPDDRDLTYENAQARERTQVLMDLANDEGALMIGTGDLSELCLGWTTYNGDHMSMYGVNASIPKTLVRYLCQGYAILHPESAAPLNDIISTPISPELLPTDANGAIEQKTEDKIGPYELHDFFIYHFLRFGYEPKKLFFLAQQAYREKYDDQTIKKWLRVFFVRFFRNQFKRSCLPDGAKVGTVAISPRGDLRMPSDASVEDYLSEIDAID